VYELEVLVKHQEDVAIKQQAVLDRTSARLERKHFQLQQVRRGVGGWDLGWGCCVAQQVAC
jgi:hypothetical protein